MSRWNSVPHALGAALLMVMLCGCVAGPNFVPPKEDSPSGYTAAPMTHQPTPAASAGEAAGEPSAWWQALNSLQLDVTIRAALARNRDLAASRATLAQLQALSAASEGAEYPRLDLDASAGRQKYGAAFLGPQNLPPFTFYSVGFGVSYLFDFAGGVRRSVEQQRALAVSQLHEVEAAELAVSGNVAHQALAAASARAQIQSVEALLADDETKLKLVQDAFEAGSANRVDVLNARSQRANDQTLLPALRREL